MKTTRILTCLGVLLGAGCGTSRVQWINDPYRIELAAHEKMEAEIQAQFGPGAGVGWFPENPRYSFTVSGRQVEFGLRSDGVVVWRYAK